MPVGDQVDEGEVVLELLSQQLRDGLVLGLRGALLCWLLWLQHYDYNWRRQSNLQQHLYQHMRIYAYTNTQATANKNGRNEGSARKNEY